MLLSYNQMIESLKTFYNLVSKENIDWILSGSFSLVIQGVDVKANDIDIVTDKKCAEQLDQLLSKYRTKALEYSSTSQYRSHYAHYLINGVKIDVMGDFQYMKKDGLWSDLRHNGITHEIEFKGMNLTLFILEEELKEYEELGRMDKVKKIREKLTQ
jgi:hypothetical protein